MKKAALITVQVINNSLLEQIYGTRGELNSEPDRLSKDEVAVGVLVSGAGVVVKECGTNKIRIAWPYRYCIGQGMPPNGNGDIRGAQAVILDKLPQIFVS